MIVRCTVGVLLLGIGGACSTVQPLRPLDRGQWVVESSAVGAFFYEDFVYAAAQPVVGARYGLSSKLELRAHWHPALLVSSIVSGDFGAVWHLGRLHRFGFHGLLDAWWLFDPGASTQALRGVANARALAHWEASDSVWPFASLDSGIAFDDGDWIPGVGLGLQFPLGVWELAIESRLSAFDERTRDFSQPYLGVGGRGILYGGIGVGYRL